MPCPDRRQALAIVVSGAIAAVSLGAGIGVAAGVTAPPRGAPVAGAGPPTPTVNATEPFRILAGDDADPNRTVTEETTWSLEDGELRSRTHQRGPPTYLLDGVPTSASAVMALAPATDGARSTLHRPVVVPVSDDWQQVADAPVRDVRVLEGPRSGTVEWTGRNRSSDERKVTVRHEQYGHRLPVRNATVRYGEDGYVIENPAVATVNVGRYRNYTARQRSGQRALLATADDPSRFSVARANGTPIAPSSAGGRVPTRWTDPGDAAIRHHWADITRVDPGAFDGERLLVGSGPIRLFVPGDFTGHVPPPWSQSESCGPDGRTTRRWERWSILDVDGTVARGGRQLPAVDPGIYRVRQPAASPLTIEHTASIAVRHEWGIDDDCGVDRQESRTAWVHHTIERSVPTSRVRSGNLSVEAFVLDRPGRPDEVHYHVAGNHGLTSGGLGSVTLSIGNARHTWQTPWVFYPVRTHDEVVQKRRNGTTTSTKSTAFHSGAHFPNVYRDRVEAEGHVVTANDVGFVPTVESHGGDTVNRRFRTSVRTDTLAESLYTHYGGTISAAGKTDLTEASIDLSARNVIGESIETHLHRRHFRPTRFRRRIGEDTVSFRLVSNGSGIGGRDVTVHGAKRDDAVTNETGWVRVRPTGSVVGVVFAGSDYRTDRTAYYEGERASVAAPTVLDGGVWTPAGALTVAGVGAGSVSGWLAIGWLVRWQRRRRPGP